MPQENSSFYRPLRGAAAGLASVLALAASPQAHATLGGDEASIERDRITLAGVASAPAAAAGYSVRAFTVASGTVVREYLSDTGLVFGVAWEGPAIPQLKELLGKRHFASMDEGVRARNREGRRGPMELRPDGAAGLVVDSTGHMRAFAGRAYLSDKLPTGVDADAIR